MESTRYQHMRLRTIFLKGAYQTFVQLVLPILAVEDLVTPSLLSKLGTILASYLVVCSCGALPSSTVLQRRPVTLYICDLGYVR